MRALRPLDYFQTATTLVFILLGAVVLVRACSAGAWPACLFGAVMFAYGIYRARAIARFLHQGGK